MAFQQTGTCGQEGNMTPLKTTASEAIQMSNEINLAPDKLLIPSHVPFQPKHNLMSGTIIPLNLIKGLIIQRIIKINHKFGFNRISAEFQ